MSFAGGRLGVHAEIEDADANALLFRREKDRHEVDDGAGQPTQFRDDEYIALPNVFDGSLELLAFRYRGDLFLEDFLAAGGREFLPLRLEAGDLSLSLNSTPSTLTYPD